MCLTKNGKVIATTVSDRAISALVQCTEAITLPPFTNALIKCKVPNILKSKRFEKFCLFEPSYRHKSDYAECHTYEGIVVMDNEVVNSGIFHVAMTNGSSRHIKITMVRLWEYSNPVMKIIYVLYIRLQPFSKLVKTQNHNWLKKKCTAFQLEI